MSSGFITEKEIIEAKKQKQEEWEKVRKADQPEECPEEPYDSRSLYERLNEQKIKKDLEYEEAHKLKNMVRGLNNDEVEFLKMVDETKLNLEKKQMAEEEEELKEFRSRVASLQEKASEKRVQSELKLKSKFGSTQTTTSSTRPSQRALLGAAIKRKNGEFPSNAKDTESSQHEQVGSTNNKQVKIEISTGSMDTEQENIEQNAQNENINTLKHKIPTNTLDEGQLKFIGILPGIGPFSESSDSDNSSDSDDDDDNKDATYDLLGRQRQ